VDQTSRQTLDLLASGGLGRYAWPPCRQLAAMAQAQNDDRGNGLAICQSQTTTVNLWPTAKGFFAGEGLKAEQPTLIRVFGPP